MPWWAWFEHLRLQRLLQVIHFFQQQYHIYSNKVIPSKRVNACQPIGAIFFQTTMVFYHSNKSAEDRANKTKCPRCDDY